MADSREAHVVEIPMDDNHHEENQDQHTQTLLSAMQQHPLKEISESPGHLLLLKLWQREEDLFGRRIGIKETRLQNAKREVFRLCCLFFGFHGLFLTLLFTCSLHHPAVERRACRDWWVPSCLSLLTSVVLICAVQMKLCGFWKVSRQLQRERSDARALARCIQELRMKGSTFDLSKEPQSSKRMKSSSVESKWRPLGWCLKNLVTICLLCFTGLVFPACKFIVCG